MKRRYKPYNMQTQSLKPASFDWWGFMMQLNFAMMVIGCSFCDFKIDVIMLATGWCQFEELVTYMDKATIQYCDGQFICCVGCDQESIALIGVGFESIMLLGCSIKVIIRSRELIRVLLWPELTECFWVLSMRLLEMVDCVIFAGRDHILYFDYKVCCSLSLSEESMSPCDIMCFLMPPNTMRW